MEKNPEYIDERYGTVYKIILTAVVKAIPPLEIDEGVVVYSDENGSVWVSRLEAFCAAFKLVES